jgi:hypothetical protein
MNNIDDSPGQPNEVVGTNYTPAQDSAGTTDNNNKKQGVTARWFLGEDLQKIRHSSHHRGVARAAGGGGGGTTDDMDEMDEESDHFIKDLLYPGLEGSSSRGMVYDDFFEEDYSHAQTTAETIVSRQRGSTESSSFQNTMSTSFSSGMSSNEFPNTTTSTTNTNNRASSSFGNSTRRNRGGAPAFPPSSDDTINQKLR